MTNYRYNMNWKEVELHEERVVLGEFDEFSVEDVTSICEGLIKKGEEAGLEGCFLRFESNMEPYEDFLGSPTASVWGYRKLNQKELKDVEEQKHIDEVAKEKGITPYEAGHLINLRRKGIV